MNAQGNWDLSFLYESFDDPRFAADLASLPGDIAALQALVDADGEPVAKLEGIKTALEALLAKEDRLMGYCALTMAVDATNATAAMYMDKIDVILNDLQLVFSALTRYVGQLENLENIIASSEALQSVAFALKEMQQE